MISYKQYAKLDKSYLKDKIKSFLVEDGPQGDVTTEAIFSENDSISIAEVSAEEDFVFAGEEIFEVMFAETCQLEMLKKDADFVKNGDVIARIKGKTSELLIKERILLNLIQRLCGIASASHTYSKIANPHNVKILDTRKVTPGLRLLEKYAVAVGGAFNHRLDLSSGILIKDNHISAAGSVRKAVELCKKNGRGLPVELEVDNFEQIYEGLAAGADGFLLDNMNAETCKKAVEIIRADARGADIFIEASGGITLNNLESFMHTGINAISIGALTHSAKNCNIHIEFLT